MRKFVLCVAMVATLLVAVPLEAEAHKRSGGTRRSRGFEPSEQTLQCIRGPWQGKSMESRGNYQAVSRSGKYRGGYQANKAFWLAYAPEWWQETHNGETHWMHRDDYKRNWEDAPPHIQDEMARNGIRARGLQPWPKPNKVCPR